jgi:hypothetical protein
VLQHENGDVNIDINIIESSFCPPYAQTVHAAQGETINDKYTIWEHFNYHVSLEWFYVALSRCKQIEDVYIYSGDMKLLEAHKSKLYPDEDKDESKKNNDVHYNLPTIKELFKKKL